MNETPGQGTHDNVDNPSNFNFPHDEWFPVIVTVNFNFGIYSININGTELEGSTAESTEFGGIDFYALDPACGFYVDDVESYSNPLSIDDTLETDLKVYPIPTENVLNVEAESQINSILIYNVLGELVLRDVPNSNFTTLSVNDLRLGTYYVKVSTNQTTGVTTMIR